VKLNNIFNIFERLFQRLWYQKKLHWIAWPFVPFAWVFASIVRCRRFLYQRNLLAVFDSKIPVIVVGNLTVGGNGKTPLVIAIAEHLQNQGFKIGIVSRGYKGDHRSPMRVNSQSDASMVGDEPLMMAQKLSCPIVVGKNRVEALQYLLSLPPLEKGVGRRPGGFLLDYIISDDGLQHYALGPLLEIVVIDAERQFGNGYCLPIGPLREPISRLSEVDLIVSKGVLPAFPDSYHMFYQMGACYQALDINHCKALSTFKDQSVHAVAGLGHPEPFFKQLSALGIQVIPHAYPDHHHYSASDLYFQDDLPIILTEKDCVKCRPFLKSTHWVLPIQAIVSPGFYQHFDRLIKEKTSDG
jgi:tetraacyldisaccharide 4'-kinase